MYNQLKHNIMTTIRRFKPASEPTASQIVKEKIINLLLNY